jgi:DNA primase
VSVWEEIKSKLSVDEIIGSYLPIKPAGTNYKCICPFHKENTPSLVISPSKQIWHCFGCGAGGDIFRFVEMYENTDKKETLEILAKKANVTLEKPKAGQSILSKDQSGVEKKPELDSFQKGQKLLLWVGELYFRVLQKIIQDRHNPITQYCLKRGLNNDLIEKFKIGYAPKENFILKLAAKNNLDFELLYQVGVLKKEDGNIYKDKYKDRLIFPIFDVQGKIVGYTGRTLPYDTSERPKYLNSPQTPWFNKSKIWFGWHLSKSHILQEKKAVIVEGNLDVITAHGKGLKIALASQGTSFTEEQIKILKRLTKNVQLAFDNDEAGKIASDKFFRVATTQGMNVYKIQIPPEHKDLDEWLQKEKVDFNSLKAEYYPTYVFKHYETNLRSRDPEVQKKAILNCLDLFSVLDPLTLEQYLNRLSEITDIHRETLARFVSQTQMEKAPTTVRSLDEESTDKRKDLDIYDTIFTNWQNICAYYQGKMYQVEREYPEINLYLRQLFTILQNLSPELKKYSDFQEYKEANREILELIFQEKFYDKDSAFFRGFLQTIIRLLDQKIDLLLLDENIKHTYFQLKKELAGVKI